MKHKRLFRKLERTLQKIQDCETERECIEIVLDSIVKHYGPELGITGGRVYEREADQYRLVRWIGPSEDEQGDSEVLVPRDYAPIQRLIQNGYLIIDPSDPDYDREVEDQVGASLSAAISLGEDGKHIIAFDLAERKLLSDIIFSLQTIRTITNLRLRQSRLEDTLWRAREIQRSILPKRLPEFGTLDLWGRSEPADLVGGDVFGYQKISDTTLAIMIADASGHGLPAALQARDVMIGLQMGIEKDLKIARVIEKLNKVIHHSSLSSKFISMFYGEIELNGNFFYINAGHHPGLLLRDGEIQELSRGGPVLGPSPRSSYDRGYVEFRETDLLVLFTDGLIETRTPSDEEFGAERFHSLIKECKDLSAREIVDRIFDENDRWLEGEPAPDDRTALVVKGLKKPGA